MKKPIRCAIQKGKLFISLESIPTRCPFSESEFVITFQLAFFCFHSENAGRSSAILYVKIALRNGSSCAAAMQNDGVIIAILRFPRPERCAKSESREEKVKVNVPTYS